MANVLCRRVFEKNPKIRLSGKAECDEVYAVAGHKGNPAAVKKEKLYLGHSFNCF
jgi:hypothetical protein